FVQVPRKNFGVCAIQVLGAEAPAQIDLEMLTAEVRNVARAGGIALNRLAKPGGVEVLTAAANRAQRQTGGVEHLLERLGRLLEVLRHVVLEGLEAVVAVPRRHLDTCLGMRRQLSKLVAAHGVPHLVARKRRCPGSKGGDNTGTEEFAARQHREPPSAQYACTFFQKTQANVQ